MLVIAVRIRIELVGPFVRGNLGRPQPTYALWLLANVILTLIPALIVPPTLMNNSAVSEIDHAGPFPLHDLAASVSRDN